MIRMVQKDVTCHAALRCLKEGSRAVLIFQGEKYA